ncbi:hypothetical protein MPSEU_000254200 [Mayamaea pseudoterrestris]|nr:hypothetical protein MPSEU_000254200 [Mayamaea pseudoterrestris]
MENAKDEARKKRDSEVNKDETILPPKKMRSVLPQRDDADNDSMQQVQSQEIGTLAEEDAEKDTESIVTVSARLEKRLRCWNLESALHRLVRVGSSPCTTTQELPDDDSKMQDVIECLTPTSSLHFRMGHGGDASAIAELYRMSQRADTEPSVPERPTAGKSPTKASDKTYTKVQRKDDGATAPAADDLEVWLADAFGNEDIPPSAYALIADIHEHTDAAVENLDNDDDKQPLTNPEARSSPSAEPTITLGALAILTETWENGSRMLRVEWMYVQRDYPLFEIVERRMWLRLSTLALMTRSQGMIVKESTMEFPRLRGSDSNAYGPHNSK